MCTCRLESTLIFKGGSLLTLTNAFNIGVANSFLMAITFLSYTAAGGELTPRKVFVTLSLIDVVRRTSFHYLVQCIFFISEIRVAFVRLQVYNFLIGVAYSLTFLDLQKFLLLEDLVDKQKAPKSKGSFYLYIRRCK